MSENEGAIDLKPVELDEETKGFAEDAEANTKKTKKKKRGPLKRIRSGIRKIARTVRENPAAAAIGYVAGAIATGVVFAVETIVFNKKASNESEPNESEAIEIDDLGEEPCEETEEMEDNTDE